MDRRQADSAARFVTRHDIRPVAAWWAVAVLFLLYAFAFVDRQVLNLMVDPIRRTLGVSDFQISLLQGIAFALFYTAFGIPLGMAADRLPRRRVILGGMIVWAAAASACGLATRYWQLFLGRLGVGAGEAALAPAAYSLLADIFPRDRLAVPLSIMGIGAALGASIAAVIATVVAYVVPGDGLSIPLLGTLAGWQIALLVSGVPGLLLAPLILTLPEPLRGGGATSPGLVETDDRSALHYMWQNRQFYASHFVGFGLYSMMNYGVSTWLPTYLLRVRHWSPAEMATTVGTLPLIATMPGAVLVAWGVDRWYGAGRKDAHFVAFAVAGIVQAFAILCAIAATSTGVMLSSLWIQASVASFTGVAAAILQISTPPALRGRVSATYLLVFSLLGLGIGPSSVAFVTDYMFENDDMVGWSMVIVTLVTAPVASLLMMRAAKVLRVRTH